MKIVRNAQTRTQEEIAASLIALMRKGFDMGKIKVKNRDELYDRN
ncbi:MAG TPA: hypothetical protein VJK72_00475 [Candidatus Nanoarchaeia archaeon]|nr:hypothetical protein [Candidatus Nanoarchaeia archaeon]